MKTHMTCIGTAYTLCGELYIRVISTNIIALVDCEVCIRNQFEGEVEYVKNLKNKKEENKIISWVLATCIGGALVICTLLFLLAVLG